MKIDITHRNQIQYVQRENKSDDLNESTLSSVNLIKMPTHQIDSIQGFPLCKFWHEKNANEIKKQITQARTRAQKYIGIYLMMTLILYAMNVYFVCKW